MSTVTYDYMYTCRCKLVNFIVALYFYERMLTIFFFPSFLEEDIAALESRVFDFQSVLYKHICTCKYKVRILYDFNSL